MDFNWYYILGAPWSLLLLVILLKEIKTQGLKNTPQSQFCCLNFSIIHMNAHTAVCSSHTSFITLIYEWQKETSTTHNHTFNEGFFNSNDKEGKKKDLMYPWLPWLYCYLAWAVDVIKVLGEKLLGKGCNCKRKHHTQVLQELTGWQNWPESVSAPKPIQI